MHYFRTQRGFTLIELMVSISIFSLVMFVSMGAILSVVDANRKSKTLRAVMDNINFTLEGMTRTIRFGDRYHCGSSGDTSAPNDCITGDTQVTVRDSDGNQVTYALTGNRITQSINGSTPYYLTSPDVTIESMKFWVFGSAPFATDQLQPRMVIVIRGYADSTNITKSSFTLETMVSQRTFDFQ